MIYAWYIYKVLVSIQDDKWMLSYTCLSVSTIILLFNACFKFSDKNDETQKHCEGGNCDEG